MGKTLLHMEPGAFWVDDIEISVTADERIVIEISNYDVKRIPEEIIKFLRDMIRRECPFWITFAINLDNKCTTSLYVKCWEIKEGPHYGFEARFVEHPSLTPPEDIDWTPLEV